ncbi:MAG: DUF4397 domain-containing protein [Gemmatimonadota bacterium]
MKLRAWIPCLALAALSLGACDDDDGTGLTTTSTARVRFVNAVTVANGNILLTSNGAVVGSAQAFGSFTPACAVVQAGTNRSLAFGTANTGGTGISSTLGTMSTSFGTGGNFTVLATGAASSPTLLVLNNTATTAAASGFANVRFVNATAQPVDFFTTSGATLNGATFSNVGANQVSTSGNIGFARVPTANSTLTFTSAGSTTPIFTTSGSFTSAGSHTVVLLPNAAGTGFQAVTLSGC